MPISEQHYIELQEKGEELEAQFVFSEQKFAIACNANFPEDLLARMQGALDKLIEYGLDRRAGEVLFSPSHGQVDVRALADWIVADNLPVRLQLQLHKIIWNDAPGH